MAKFLREATATLGLFVILVLAFTATSLLVSPPVAKVGSARALLTVPIHEIELLTAGVVLGLIALVICGRAGFYVGMLLPFMVILLDLDHIPAFLGVAQPIRPAHSFVFLAVDVILTTILLRRLSFGFISMSAYLGHMGIDSGIFPPLSPFSFQYVQLEAYSIPFLIASVALAFVAGAIMRRRSD